MARWPKQQGTENAAGGADSAPVAPLAETVEQPAKAPASYVVVMPPRDGRWRAGMHFDARVAFVAGALTDAELAALKGDPSFAVAEVTELPPGMSVSEPKRGKQKPAKVRPKTSGGYAVKVMDGGQGLQ